MSVIQARLPDGTPITQVDAQQSAMEGTIQAQQQQAIAEYHLIRIKIQDVPVAMKVNVGDLRAVLELPSYSLRQPIRAPPSTTTPALVEDIVGAKHIDG
ncbi:hypothetical protein PHMEG_00015596 [Phytophthora megakarya]|uniref:Uncharacterized protein n=1 Tax=Phytophthora megakarya TaxID=4795 RepID=A0A225W0W1_9STRA|nr:hypothetical protein PHMEG_00015596 [Phytophthora megakarya]